MIGLCIICVLFGMSGVIWGVISSYIRKKTDTKTIEYNQKLNETKKYLEQEILRLENEKAQKINSIELIYQQNDDLVKDQICLQNILNQLTQQQQKLTAEI